MIGRLRGAVRRATGAVRRLAAMARRAGRAIGRAAGYGARMALERCRRLRAPGAVRAGAVLGVLAAVRGACWQALRAPLTGRVLVGRVIVSPRSSGAPSWPPARRVPGGPVAARAGRRRPGAECARGMRARNTTGVVGAGPARNAIRVPDRVGPEVRSNSCSIRRAGCGPGWSGMHSGSLRAPPEYRPEYSGRPA